jgi:hypothetical protein
MLAVQTWIPLKTFFIMHVKWQLHEIYITPRKYQCIHTHKLMLLATTINKDNLDKSLVSSVARGWRLCTTLFMYLRSSAHYDQDKLKTYHHSIQ